MIDFFNLVSGRTELENIEFHLLQPQQPVFPPLSFSKPSKASSRLKTTAYTRDFSRGVPYPSRGGVGEIYLDPSRIMSQAANQGTEGHESEYSSFKNPIFSSTDMGLNLPR